MAMPCTYISCVAECHMGRESMGTLIQAKMPEEGETLLSRFGGQVQTIYLDPPFNTGKQFDMKVRIKTDRPASICPLMTTAGRIARNIWR